MGAVSVPETRLLREVPLYSVTDAARFTGARPLDVRRWVEGYTFRSGVMGPVSEPAKRLKSGNLYLTFHHLIEVWSINRMRRPPDGGKGLSLQQVRQAAASARQQFGTDFPLADERLQWDGAGIFYRTLGALAVDEGLVELSRRSGQMTWSKFVEDGLKRIQYQDQLAVRLWPLGQSRFVVLDPSLNDGWPTVTRGERLSGIPAEVVAEMVSAGDSVEGVAAAYRLTPAAVHDAVTFVSSWAKAAA
jgi:uncharacterized protein (DUF433 family)